MFVVTGGGSGIGRALAYALADRGKPVLVVGRRESMLLETATYSPLITVCCADLTQPLGREHLATVLDGNKLNGLIHNAGTIEPMALLAEVTSDAWQNALNINLTVPLLLTQKLLAKNTPARILHISSGAAHFPVAGWGAYCVSKAGLAMLTRCWQLEHADKSTLFSSVMPGIIDTDMQALIRKTKILAPDKQHFFQTLYEKNILLSPATVALFLTWLLLDTSAEAFIQDPWDIYDTTHHASWLIAPHQVPHWGVMEGDA